MLASIITLSSAVCAIATLLPLANFSIWWVRIFDFPRCQLALAITANLFIIVAYGHLNFWFWQTLVVTNIASLLVQVWWIAPYFPGFPKQVPPCQQPGHHDESKLSLLSCNVLMPNRNAQGLLKMIASHEPDIVVTLESDAWWQRQLQILPAQGYNHTVQCPLDNLYGMHVFSKLKLHHAEVKYLVESKVPSVHCQVELRTGKHVQLHVLHPAPPSPTENTYSSERDAELIIVAKQVAELTSPVIVMGDLNDVAWSKTTRIFRRISGLRDPRIGRGMFNTFHADYWWLRWPLDHLFHSSHFSVDTIARLRLKGSDHFTLFTRLCFQSQHGQGNNSPEELSPRDQDLVDDRLKDNNIKGNSI